MERKNSQATNRDGLLYRSLSKSAATTSSDFVLQWGNRKRLRCMKVHAKGATNNDPDGSDPSQRAAARVDRRVVRSDLLTNNNNNTSKNPIPNPPTITNGYLNLRHRSASPSNRILRNSEREIGMRGNSNGVRGLASPDTGERKATSTSNNAHSHHHNNKTNNSNHSHENHHHQGGGGGGSGSSENAHDAKKGDSDAAAQPPVVWPKFVIALTNKEKEEDFMAIKGSKLPQRPKKRAKLIQRTLNLVSPGTWLCDLTLERYEVREKKVSKKRPRGLRAMGNMIESDSE
ncbi:GATA zinc finger domain-containing protein 14-like isoform X1 [Salvia splendens]|uniref:GATA zinc finger domain-containing protein 14-like isoform X1 n=1 Tax=Salvia splendens TaxID=180675 RepID=UPI001C25AD6C|nr:GATA zinc finger domain-containing protein 14-like isoform X1 [Salvia splendens]XP_041994429.1 GATA zinc finger domain-containing protein 14-like isoform X1 [Salvia splendens]XP_041994430.1 GATA zinc finger domain-containing protein 14-like isoform X1 [Salvia splendens]XP_041994431.1 GATA zinc finger domain-containing protein 14-like isoform X1 [Salvia splendens]